MALMQSVVQSFATGFLLVKVGVCVWRGMETLTHYITSSLHLTIYPVGP